MNRRFALALLLSLLLHLLVPPLLTHLLRHLLPTPKPLVKRDATLTVHLLNARQERPPLEETKRHAPHPLEGGGETPETHPTAPQPPTPLTDAPLSTPPSSSPSHIPSPLPPQPPPDPPSTSPPSSPSPAPPSLAEAQPRPRPSPSPPASHPSTSSPKPSPRPPLRPTPSQPSGVPRAALPPAPSPSLAPPAHLPPSPPADLLDIAHQLTQLRAEIDRETRAIAERPRKRHVGVTVRDHPLAAYIEAWRQKIIRLGTLNFPTDARGQKLYGTLILEVAIDASGKLLSATVIEPSRSPALDAAALKIVHLAAPYAPFPPEIAADTDILVITRRITFTHTGLTTP
ncbi:MAG: energy transducer TonB [Hydrogenophilus sp.]|nr:energy transducer TonB [Hydrogenophilus sp.]